MAQGRPDRLQSLVGHVPLISLIISVLSIVISIGTYMQNVKGTYLAQRAYLSHTATLLDGKKLMSSVRNNDPLVTLNYRFTVTNLGNTPATDIEYAFNHNIPSTSQTAGTWNETSLRYSDLGPKDSHSATRTLLYENKKRDMATKEFFSAGITGSVTYKDVFAKSHSLSICYLIIASSTDARIDNCHQQEGMPTRPKP